MRRSWSVYALVGLLATAASMIFPDAAREPLSVGIGATAVVALLAGIRHHGLARRSWLGVAGGISLFVLGDLVSYIRGDGDLAPTSMLLALLGLAAYLVLGLALTSLVRSRTSVPDWGSLIDALILVGGIGVVAWALLIIPHLPQNALSAQDRVVSALQPAGALVLLGVGARLAIGIGTRTPALHLLLGAVGFLLLADTLHGFLTLTAGNGSSVANVEWSASYVLWGAAALHPGALILSEPAAVPKAYLSWPRLALLSALCLTGPALLGLEVALGVERGIPFLVAGSGGIALLVVTRMGSLSAPSSACSRPAARRCGGSKCYAGPARRWWPPPTSPAWTGRPWTASARWFGTSPAPVPLWPGARADTGLIVPLGRWVLDEACRQMSSWTRSDPSPPATISVNVSVRQLEDDGLAADLIAILDRHDLRADQLVLEVTESALMRDEEGVVRRLQELKEIGVLIAIDDFGTGYSSFSYMSRFPIDVVKIDREFTRSVLEPRGCRLVAAILEMAHTLEMRTVAEGIEQPAQAAELAGWAATGARASGWPARSSRTPCSVGGPPGGRGGRARRPLVSEPAPAAPPTDQTASGVAQQLRERHHRRAGQPDRRHG